MTKFFLSLFSQKKNDSIFQTEKETFDRTKINTENKNKELHRKRHKCVTLTKINSMKTVFELEMPSLRLKEWIQQYFNSSLIFGFGIETDDNYANCLVSVSRMRFGVAHGVNAIQLR